MVRHPVRLLSETSQASADLRLSGPRTAAWLRPSPESILWVFPAFSQCETEMFCMQLLSFLLDLQCWVLIKGQSQSRDRPRISLEGDPWGCAPPKAGDHLFPSGRAFCSFLGGAHPRILQQPLVLISDLGQTPRQARCENQSMRKLCACFGIDRNSLLGRLSFLPFLHFFFFF